MESATTSDTADDVAGKWGLYLHAYGKKPTTVRHYPRVAREWMSYLASRRTTYDRAQYEDVDAYVVWCRNERVPTLSAWTMRCQMSILNRFYRWLKRNRFAWENPFDATEKIEAEPPPPNPLQEAQVLTLLELEGHPMWRAMWEVFYATGARHTPVLTLKVNDLDLDRKRIRFTSGKRNRVKAGLIGRPCVEALNLYLPWRQMRLKRLKVESDWLWIAHKGTPHPDHDTVLARFKEACERAGIKERVYIHRLRHSTGTHMLDHGANLRAVQETLGHASVMTTQGYTYVSQGHLRDAFDRSHPRA